MDGVRTPDRLLACLREAEKADLPFAHQVGHRADDIFDRHLWVNAMLIEQIDAICRESAQRPFDRIANALRPAVDARHRAVLDSESELRRDEDTIALPLQGAAQ